MKTFLLSLLLTLSIYVHAQIEQPFPMDLSTFSPSNPEQANSYLPVQLSNKNVASILTIGTDGLAIKRTIYNEVGWPITMENTSETFNYYYSPDKRTITVENKYIYDLDAKGNVTELREVNHYGSVENKTVNTYDENGNLIKSQKFQPRQVNKNRYELTVIAEVNYKYDDKNRVIAQIGDAYQYDYDYKIINNQLIVTSLKNNEKVSESTYDKNGVLIQYKYLLYGTKNTEYDKTYNNQGLLVKEKVTSTIPSDNKTNAYVITYRDGTIESPNNDDLQFLDPKKKHNIYTKATSSFSKQEGLFEKGILNGPGFMSKNGVQYKGNFENGELSGFGQTHLPLGKQTITYGVFEKGELNGYGFVIQGENIVEAGIYKDGKLIKNLDEDHLSKKSTIYCKGNCINGFGIKKDNDTTTYSIFENGNAVGPYITIINNKMVQYGAKTKDFHFLEGVIDGAYYYGLWYNKNATSKIIKRTTESTEAGVMKDGIFKKTYEFLTQ